MDAPTQITPADNLWLEIMLTDRQLHTMSEADVRKHCDTFPAWLVTEYLARRRETQTA